VARVVRDTGPPSGTDKVPPDWLLAQSRQSMRLILVCSPTNAGMSACPC